MAQSLVGNVHEFDPAEEEWKHYAEQLSEYFIGNGIDNADKKRAILLSSVGPRTYKLLSDLVSPQTPSQKTFDELCVVLKDHYKPREPVMVSRFNFNKRDRKENKTITEYIRELRKLAKECQYGNNLSTMLRDRLAVGVNHEAIQRKLLSEEDELTFERAQTLALSIEQANDQVRKLKKEEQRVHQLKARDMHAHAGKNDRRKQPSAEKQRTTASAAADSATPVTCFCCRVQGHMKRDCKYKNATCLECKKVGHLKKTCTNKKKFGKAHYVSEDADTAEYTFSVTAGEKNQQGVSVDLSINNEEVTMEVDTGASRSLKNVDMAFLCRPRSVTIEWHIDLCTSPHNPKIHTLVSLPLYN
jgi:hypothetical protein